MEFGPKHGEAELLPGRNWYFLLNRGYECQIRLHIYRNHHLLSGERQRLALARITSTRGP